MFVGTGKVAVTPLPNGDWGLEAPQHFEPGSAGLRKDHPHVFRQLASFSIDRRTLLNEKEELPAESRELIDHPSPQTVSARANPWSAQGKQPDSGQQHSQWQPAIRNGVGPRICRFNLRKRLPSI